MAKTNLDGIVSSIKRKRSTIVGVDIDNTLIHLPVIAYINHKFGTEYKDSDLSDWGLGNFPQNIREDVLAQFKNPDFMCRARGYLWCYPTLRDWHAQGARIFAITRRSENLIHHTYSQIDREFPGLFEDVFFVRETDSKTRFLKKIDANIHIDDYDVEDGLRAGVKTWLITNEHTAYNWNMRTNTKLNQAVALRYVKLDDQKWKS